MKFIFQNSGSEDGSRGNIEKPSQKVDSLPALDEDKNSS